MNDKIVPFLFHVSPKSNRASILKSGVDPIFSHGIRKVSWWVDTRALMWAVSHCSDRYGVSPANLDVFIVKASAVPQMRNAGFVGLHMTGCRVKVSEYLSALKALETYSG